MLHLLIDANLEQKIISIFEESSQPLTVDQVVYQVFFKEQRMADLILIAGPSIEHKKLLQKRIKTIVEKSDFLEADHDSMELRYRLRSHAVNKSQA
jgi:hypothetical protein